MSIRKLCGHNDEHEQHQKTSCRMLSARLGQAKLPLRQSVGMRIRCLRERVIKSAREIDHGGTELVGILKPVAPIHDLAQLVEGRGGMKLFQCFSHRIFLRRELSRCPRNRKQSTIEAEQV